MSSAGATQVFGYHSVERQRNAGFTSDMASGEANAWREDCWPKVVVPCKVV